MEARTTPTKFLILKFDDFSKVFASWYGGYLDGDSWSLNSGIEKVEDDGDSWLFYGFSGSVYQCRKDSYGTHAYGYALLTSWGERGIDFEIMPADFDPMTLNELN